MYFILAEIKKMINGVLSTHGLDSKHPIASYPDMDTAVSHARAHTTNHDVKTVVVSESQLNSLRKLDEESTPSPQSSTFEFWRDWGDWKGSPSPYCRVK